MAEKFELTIELGNDAMQTHAHVARALEGIAEHLRQKKHPSFGAPEHWKIRDVNGNTVGYWETK